MTEDGPPTPHPGRDTSRSGINTGMSRGYFQRNDADTSSRSSDPVTAAREARAQLDDYLRRFNPDMLEARNPSSAAPSPPPQYEPLASHPDVNTFTSRDAPEPHPVSPPSARSERDIGDALLSGDEGDLDAMRRVVQRLAQREDVPDEWWMSMGLNLSRTRARSRSPRGVDRAASEQRAVRTGRITRINNDSRTRW